MTVREDDKKETEVFQWMGDRWHSGEDRQGSIERRTFRIDFNRAVVDLQLPKCSLNMN